ncbi:class F sortase [Demequina lignilytica]|uniref:Class F sortase n=1 Tax=Demequina lignilytica TaxID=3051663 RepID=A0AAW7M481_9MICO|nr:MULTISPECIES: class F sortase [unclassified Demequina]MDN4478003.1 class F sortase [Demequina sp. SYSU T00039-1]MDN4482917.1 class F sortase [Demequina sp. SYSU T0a273]MDN4488547.1 class F sortase [Demequina sp. SYSU T00039]MDN4489906.1 class F sortase [Demequina sp. SYSU T00068]
MRTLAVVLAATLALSACAAAPSSAPPSPAGAPDAPLLAEVQAPVNARVVTGEIPVASAAAEDLAVAPTPSGLRVPRLEIDMAVLGVGLDADGGMELRESAAEAGWFRAGGNPGGGLREGQNAVIAAHVDDGVIGRGPFASLREARPGDRVEVELTDGSVVVYQVDRVQQTSKREVDFSVVFGAAEGALVLVTCGGRWDADVRHYEDNVLVWAFPEDGR